ncbi:MAG: class I SAM-dependent methyltransferase, partial [Gaiellaceae bacterium]
MSKPSPEALAAEVETIREEYRRRGAAPQCRGSYSFLNPTHVHVVLERERAILGAIARQLRVPLAQADVLDVGSSSGLSLGLLSIYGAEPSRLHGVDTDPDRIEAGGRRFPAFDLRVSDGMNLPYDDDSFDLVQQITMLSSVHSDDLRRQIAGEMLRVARPGALVLSYDAASVGLAPRVANRLLGL